MRRSRMWCCGTVLALAVLVTGCASDRGFHCGGDLVPINPPAKTAVPKPRRGERTDRAPGASP